MFKKAKPATINGSSKPSKSRELIPTIVTPDVHLLGNMVSEGSVDFSGTIDGNIRCDTLTLRECGTIKGEITANNVFIHGTVKGLIRAKNVHLLAACKVEGIIMHEQISIEDGAFVDGKFKRSDRVKEAGETEDSSSESGESSFDGNPATMLTRSVASPSSTKVLDNIRLIR